MKLKKTTCFLALVLPVWASGGPYKETMKEACPNQWEMTEEAVPIVNSQYTLWPGGSDSGNDDRENVRANLSTSETIVTIAPATEEDLVDDPLTVASNCLKYRNYEVDYAVHEGFAPPYVDLTKGWIPAAAF